MASTLFSENACDNEKAKFRNKDGNAVVASSVECIEQSVVDNLAQAIADAIGGGGTGDGMICDRQVANIVGGTPLVVTTSEMDHICDVEFSDEFGNKIELAYQVTGIQEVTICSNVSLNNIQVFFMGEN